MHTKGFDAFALNHFPPKGGFDVAPKIVKLSEQASVLTGRMAGIFS